MKLGPAVVEFAGGVAGLRLAAGADGGTSGFAPQALRIKTESSDKGNANFLKSVCMLSLIGLDKLGFFVIVQC